MKNTINRLGQPFRNLVCNDSKFCYVQTEARHLSRGRVTSSAPFITSRFMVVEVKIVARYFKGDVEFSQIVASNLWG